ncbi:MAG TPA: hypothetical protein VMW36_01525 [Patescibacteria group bacterium]|nr:hypothetical protein [Patescibacteria group bacterium]
MNKLYRRLLDLCLKHKQHHLGSYFSSLPVIDEIFTEMNLDRDIFILSSGHAALALYVVLEKHYGFDAEEMLLNCGEHPKLDVSKKIFCSTGSLGMGFPVAVGRAIADPTRKVYCLISDGECGEGSIWEAMQHTQKLDVSNLDLYVNLNGVAAYGLVDEDSLSRRLISFMPSIQIRHTDATVFSLFEGIDSHYKTLNVEDYKKVVREIEESI